MVTGTHLLLSLEARNETQAVPMAPSSGGALSPTHKLPIVLAKASREVGRCAHIARPAAAQQIVNDVAHPRLG